MADHSQRLAIVVTAQDLASGKLGKVRMELASMGTSGKLASVGLGGAMLAVNKGEQALGNFKNRLTSLAAPLAMIGLSGGLFTLGGAFAAGITKANDWGLAIEKLQGMTSDSAQALSGYLALTDKFNISEASATQIVGFTEKALGKLQMAVVSSAKAGKSAALQSLETQKLQIQEAGGKTTLINKLISEQKARDALAVASGKSSIGATKLTALEKLYGVTLADNKGQALSFTTVLLNVADAYSKASTAAQKAKMDALAAAVFGRGYATLIPILKLGKQGILDAESAAAQLGLTLSTTNVADLAKFRASTREAGDAVSGLELQLGLMVMPDITAGLKAFSGFMQAHQPEVKQFFSDGLHVAEALGGFITGTLVPAISSVAGAATGIWNSIPGPMKDLLVKGVVADRTMKFFFGMSPIHAVVSLAEGAFQKGLSGLVGGIFTRGSSPANPMYVSGGLGGGKPGGGPGGLANDVTTAEAAGGAAAVGNGGAMLTGGAVVAGAALSVGAVAAVAGVAIDQYSKLSSQGDALAAQATEFVKTADLSALLRGQAALVTGAKDLAGQSGYNPLASAGYSGINQAAKIIADAISAKERVLHGPQGPGAPTQAQINATRSGERSTVTSHMLSSQITAALGKGTLGASGVAQADALRSAFEESTGPSQHSMTSAMLQMKDMQARYLSQGDTKLAAAIGVDLAAVRAAVDRTTSAINAKQFVATTLNQVLPMFFPKTPPKTPAAVPVTIRDVNIGNNSRKAYGPDRKI